MIQEIVTLSRNQYNRLSHRYINRQSVFIALLAVSVLYGISRADLFPLLLEDGLPGSNYNLRDMKKPTGKNMALCLRGELRNFEFTASTFRKHVLESYEDMDIFVVSRLDDHMWKILLLDNDKRIVGISVLPTLQIMESTHGGPGLLHPSSRAQRYMQSFQEEEACLKLIRNHEAKFNFRYQWAMWVKADSLWSGPSPLVSALVDEDLVIFPQSRDVDAYNDLFAMGGRGAMGLAMSRLLSMEDISMSTSQRPLSRGRLMHFLLKLKGVNVQQIQIPFCTLSGEGQARSVLTPEAMNGGYCLPCRPNVILSNEGGDKWSCQYRVWPVEWQDVMFQMLGEGTVSKVLMSINATYSSCVSRIKTLQSRAHTWDGASPSTICLLRTMGKAVLVGTGHNRIYTFMKYLTSDSIVYSFGYSSDPSWEIDLMLRFPGLRLWSFGAHYQTIDVILSKYLTDAGFEEAEKMAKVEDIKKRWIQRPYMLLSKAIKELGHQRIDVLKIFDTGMRSPLAHHSDFWPASTPICQVVMTYGQHTLGDQVVPARIKGNMDNRGFELSHGIAEDGVSSARITFFSRHECLAHTASLPQMVFEMTDDGMKIPYSSVGSN